METYTFIMVFYTFRNRKWEFVFLTTQSLPQLVLSDLSNW